MYNSDLIQDYYSRLTNEQLIEFAKTAGEQVTAESLEILRDQFMIRGLDTSILEEALSVKGRLKVDAETTATHWDNAFKERKESKSDEEILKGLRDKGIEEERALMIIRRLPDLNYKNEKFDELVRKKCEDASLFAYLGVFLLVAICAFMLFKGMSTGFPPYLILGIVFGVVAFYVIKKFSGDMKGGYTWLITIKENPESIVWIKPIIVRHTAYYLVTLYKERQFQFLTDENKKVTITLDAEEDRQTFFEGVEHLLPHVHIGYTEEVDALYYADPEKFISELQGRGVYMPFDVVRVKVQNAGATSIA
jgi:hypothetical protein